jgi:hypothetical protein
MGSITTAQAKADELQGWAERMGEILSQKAFGEQGPDLETSLADMEQWLGPVLKRMAAGFLQQSVSQQGERLPGEMPCPTCGAGCVPTDDDKPRTMTTEHGDFRFAERSCHCDRCQRSFFPSAGDAED